MNNFTNASRTRASIRWQLLTTVSALALIASAYGVSEAEAANDDSDRPPVWIEIGGQLSRLSKPEEQFVLPFMANLPSNFFSPLNVQRPLPYSIDQTGSISFQPEGSNWVFSASLRYGRSAGHKEERQQTPNAKVHVGNIYPQSFNPGKYYGGWSWYPTKSRFEGATAHRSEKHAVLDFEAGKDVGLGMFGNRGSSVVSVGVRFAQFTSKSHISMGAAPDINYEALSTPINSLGAELRFKYHNFTTSKHHFYAGMLSDQRSFHGVGPSVSWKGSVPFAGNAESAELTLEWGINGALLFGRQKARGNHQTTTRTDYVGSRFEYTRTHINGARVAVGKFPVLHSNYAHNTSGFNRTRSVTVPNLGALAGISFRYANAKISFGYRADIFFGAMDGGIDTRKSENTFFHGPYASISVGLGD